MLGIFVSGCVLASSACASGFCGFEGGSIESWESKARATLGDAILTTRTMIGFNFAGGKGVIYFTTAEHPAHPSAVCRLPVQINGSWRIRNDIECRSTNAACKALAQSLIADGK